MLLRDAIDIGTTMDAAGRYPSLALLDFHPGQEQRHLETAAIRWFKDMRASTVTHSPDASAFCKACARTIAGSVQDWHPSHVSRALASWETRPAGAAPAPAIDALARTLAEMLGAELTYPIRRTTPRAPMSALRHLSGRDALRARLQVAAADLVLDRPLPGARILVVDDIRCLGATECVWSWALTGPGQAEAVHFAHIAQTEGLDTQVQPAISIQDIAAMARQDGGGRFFSSAWQDQHAVVHQRRDCPKAAGAPVPWWSGLPTQGGCCRQCSAPGGTLARLLQSLTRRKP